MIVAMVIIMVNDNYDNDDEEAVDDNSDPIIILISDSMGKIKQYIKQQQTNKQALQHIYLFLK